MHIDHFSPVSLSPELIAEYSNLLYCCSTCNAAKGDLKLPDPTKTLLGTTIKILADGTIETSNPTASRIIKLLGLNASKFREYRLLWMEIAALAKRYQPALYQQLMSFPDDLPDLSVLLPPDGNTRPDGVTHSYFEQKKAGTLPETY
jgi:hypothetical protein